MTTYYLAGSAALPEFRLAKMLATLRREHPAITDLAAWSAYFVDAAIPLGDDELSALGRLLDPSIRTDRHPQVRAPPDPAHALRVLVIPREGTISAWSSKATDIARNCGFGRVRRVERGTLWLVLGPHEVAGPVLEPLYDRMTERLLPIADAAPVTPRRDGFEGLAAPADIFGDTRARPLLRISLRHDPERTLRDADRRLGLALNDDEARWLCERFGALGRDPTDAELMMFAQANSEHCRHKIFNATWTVDGRTAEHSLFDMVRHTHAANPGRVLSAYRDNSAVVDGGCSAWFGPDPETGVYRRVREPAGLLMKVETHNHPHRGLPRSREPRPRSGGEIRDEAATGRGAGSRAGLVGFSVSALRIPGYEQPWEGDGPGAAPHLASALEIMLDAPVGAARFNNEFGRPALGGYFRTFEQPRGEGGGDWYGYHKPIMIAGGMGRIRKRHVAKDALRPGMLIGVLGGPRDARRPRGWSRLFRRRIRSRPARAAPAARSCRSPRRFA